MSLCKDQQIVVFALVHPIGVKVDDIKKQLETRLRKEDFEISTIKISEKFISHSNAQSEFKKAKHKIEQGNRLRKKNGLDYFSKKVAKKIQAVLKTNGKKKHAFIIDSCKHEAEVHLLRFLFERHFFLIGVFDTEENRKNNIKEKIGNAENSTSNVHTLITMDSDSQDGHGQKTYDALSLADFFIHAGNANFTAAMERFLNILFGSENTISPNIEEFCMNMAFQASARSAFLARQVGSIILSDRNEIISIGYNERPAKGGLQNHSEGIESFNDRKENGFRREMLMELKESIVSTVKVHIKDGSKGKFSKLLDKSKLKDLLEFMEEVHAEQAAIIAAMKQGANVEKSVLFVTTYPCHLCAKLIIASGIDKVVYVEPYFKSLASRMYGNDLITDKPSEASGKVLFELYQGIGWRIYSLLFRKDQMDEDIKFPERASLESCKKRLEIVLKERKAGSKK